jgi:DNA polymerase
MQMIHPCPVQLQDKIRTCTACKLNQAPYNPGLPTIGIGSANPKLFLLGRDPGEHEAKEGKPFVGPAGKKVLQPILQALDITLDDFYLTNIVKHRPPKNIEPDDSIKIECSKFLLEEIEWAQPVVIVALGKAAGTALNLIQKTDFPVSRGSKFIFKDIPVLCTWHPAYVVRNITGPAYQELQDDINRAFAYANALRGTDVVSLSRR